MLKFAIVALAKHGVEVLKEKGGVEVRYVELVCADGFGVFVDGGLAVKVGHVEGAVGELVDAVQARDDEVVDARGERGVDDVAALLRLLCAVHGFPKRAPLDALLDEFLGGGLGRVARDATKRVLAVERRVVEDGADDATSLVAGGTKDGEELLGRHCLDVWDVEMVMSERLEARAKTMDAIEESRCDDECGLVWLWRVDAIYLFGCLNCEEAETGARSSVVERLWRAAFSAWLCTDRTHRQHRFAMRDASQRVLLAEIREGSSNGPCSCWPKSDVLAPAPGISNSSSPIPAKAAKMRNPRGSAF
ncbi:hypothetical protein L1887_60035 [Cichorium endivia]|nr:hypothetical protein L1887_60035 [Cichorium endivia]